MSHVTNNSINRRKLESRPELPLSPRPLGEIIFNYPRPRPRPRGTKEGRPAFRVWSVLHVARNECNTFIARNTFPAQLLVHGLWTFLPQVSGYIV